MKINTTETHQRSHRIVLSQQQVNALLKEIVCREIGVAPKAAFFDFRWGETSVDSGLRKEPEIVIQVTEDLSPRPAEAPAPTEADDGL